MIQVLPAPPAVPVVDTEKREQNNDEIDNDHENDEHRERYKGDSLDPNWIHDEILANERNCTRQQKLACSICKKEEMIQKKTTAVKGEGAAAVTWTVRDDVLINSTVKEELWKQVGVKGFNFRNKPIKADGNNNRANFLHLLQYLWLGLWKNQIKRMNKKIKIYNNQPSLYRRQKIHLVIEREFWKFFGILLVARLEGIPGGNLWKNGSQTERYKRVPNLEKYVMNQYRFKEIKRYLVHAWENEELKEKGDSWWMVSQLIDDFNSNKKSTVWGSNDKLADEIMSVFWPQTTKTGNLPHLLFIHRKPEDLGTELKAICDAIAGIMIAVEIQQARKYDWPMKYMAEAKGRKTAACSLRLMEAPCKRSQVIGVLHDALIKNQEASNVIRNDNPTDDCFLGDSWFGSIPTALTLKKNVAYKKDSILVVKTGHARYPKKFIKDTMNDWLGGTHIVLEAIVEDVKLFTIVYKYSSKKCLCFLITEGGSHTEAGEPYRAKYIDNNGNSCFRDVPRPQCCSKYFRSSNKIDVHNQQRQKELRLEKHWVTEDGYFRLITTVFRIGIVDLWRSYDHHLPSKHCHKD